MPIFYNTGTPSSGNQNGITITAKNLGLRDFLLSKNIQNPIKYPQLATSINGAPRGGQPVLDTMVGNGSVPTQVPVTVTGLAFYGNNTGKNLFKDTDSAAPIILSVNDATKIPIFPEPLPGTTNYSQEDLTKYGILPKSDYKHFRETSTLKNLYLDTGRQVDMSDYISLQPILTSTQIKGGYLDEYGDLNLGQSGAVHAADILGGALNGGLGLGNGGLVSNFDIRSSLAGRVLTAAGVLNDSKLGVIGGKQLALALANNAAFNIQQQALGVLNIQENVVSLIKGNGLAGTRPDYTITVPSSTGGKILSYAEKVLGFVVPHSYLQPEGSIFTSENGGVVGNIERANSMLINTGLGQIKSLAVQVNANLFGTSNAGYDSPKNTPFRSGYTPGYKDHNGNQLYVPVGYAFMKADGTITNFVGSVSTSNVIPEISYNREKMVEDAGFVSPENQSQSFSTNTSVNGFGIPFSWSSNNGKAVNAKPNWELLSKIDKNNNVLTDEQAKKQLLFKTQTLFNSVGMRNLVAVKGDMRVKNKTQLQTSVSPVGGISRGSGVLSALMFNNKSGQIFANATGQTADNTFCRVWTPYDRYDTVGKLIRHRGLNQAEGSGNIITNTVKNKWRTHTEGSVLDDNGFVKIAPYKTDELSRNGSYGASPPTSPKKYMFSIENLAWAGTAASNLLPVEQGPGDLLTGKFGRIMWFPPYDLTFSETSSVNIESTNFIGRGEPVYTYNNTERTGNLSFKMFVDHPSIMNSFAGNNGPSDEFIRSWFAGCTDLDESWGDRLTFDEKEVIKSKRVDHVNKVKVEKPTLPSDITFYFPNDVTLVEGSNSILSLGANNYKYEFGTGSGAGSYFGEPQYNTFDDEKNKRNGEPSPDPKTHKGMTEWPDKTDTGLNKGKLTIPGKKDYKNGWNDKTYLADLKDYLINTCPKCKVSVSGFASKQGGKKVGDYNRNDRLSYHRAESIKAYLINNGIVDASRFKKNPDIPNGTKVNNTYDKNTASVDAPGPKSDRTGLVHFDIDGEDLYTDEKTYTDEPMAITELNAMIKKRFYTESDFFEKLTEEDPLVFDKIRQKIRYFHPAFHSTTPEGLNSRLTFLLQCTRQGATQAIGKPDNLAFGQPPVCILRIGDFYNTKIMIDNLTLNFEEQIWDLNPEGVGVQPMVAIVNISFKYIGGSTLYGPINKLQNALSFNYFANTQVYDPRANYITASEGNLFNTRNNKFNSETSLDSSGNLQTKFREEQDYQLNIEYDPLTRSMGQLSVNEIKDIEKLNIPSQNQIADANKATDPTQVKSDADRLQLINLSASTMSFDSGTIMTFDITRKDSTDQASLNQTYNVIMDIVNKTNPDEKWQTKTLGTYGSNPTESYSFNFKDTIPPCTGFTTGNTYSFKGSLYSDYGDVINFADVDVVSQQPITNNDAGTTNTGEYKLLGFNNYEIDKTTEYNLYTFSVALKQQNMFKYDSGKWVQLISDEDLAKFVAKGIKITVEATPVPLPDYRFEVVLATSTYKPTYDPGLGNGSECTSNCYYNLPNAIGGSGILIGEKTKDYFVAIKLADGNYMLTLTYDGTVIQRVPIKIPQDKYTRVNL